MATDLTDVHGPIDFLLLQVPPGADTTAMGEALFEIVNRGIVRIYDLLIIRKEADGSFSGIDLNDLSSAGLGGFTAFAGAQSGLLSDDDLHEAAGVMDPGSLAALFIYENSWAIPFVGAALDAKAEVIATERIPATVVMEVLDLLEAAEAAS
jgi:Family of unknown function (DUF6325)